MSTVQFEPKISTDLPINWNRPASSPAADMFADLLADRLKQNAEADRRQPAPKRHQPAPDPLAGRPSRLAVTHPRTVRGEAKEVEDTSAHLADQRDCATEQECTPATDETPTVADDVDAGIEQEAAGTDAEADASEDMATATAEPVQPQEPEAVVVVATQPAEQTEAGGEAELALALPIPESAEGEIAVPVPAEDTAAAAPEGSQDESGAAAEQQAVSLLAEAELAEVAAALTGGEGATLTSVEAPAVVTQAAAAPAVAAPAETPLEQMLETPQQPMAEPVPASQQPQADKHSMDIKLRSGTPRPQAAAADPKPGATPAPQSQAHQVAPLQPSPTGEFDGTGDLLDQPVSPDGSGPGWTLHLAQGAAAKRPDFVAQLRQHLQNLPAHEQVAVHVQRALREGTGRFSVQLSPAELGHIHVKLEIDEDKRVTAAVTVERPSTLELLQRDIKGLERALHNAGLSLEGGDLSFSLGRGDQEFAQDLNQSAASAAGGTVPDAETAAEQTASAGAQVMDTAAGVVNLKV